MITHKEYLKSLEIVNSYLKQKEQSTLSVNDLTPGQKVKRNYPHSWDYWVSEIEGEDVLIRTTENENDPEYDDFWVNISELRLI